MSVMFTKTIKLSIIGFILFPAFLIGWLGFANVDVVHASKTAANVNVFVNYFVVNAKSDGVDVQPGNGVCETATNNGICTLRAAIQETNANVGADTIYVPAGIYTLGLPGWLDDTSATGDLDVLDDLTITGDGPEDTIIDGNAAVLRTGNRQVQEMTPIREEHGKIMTRTLGRGSYRDGSSAASGNTSNSIPLLRRENDGAFAVPGSAEHPPTRVANRFDWTAAGHVDFPQPRARAEGEKPAVR